MNVTLKQIADFNEELAADIKATRRTAYGAEEQMLKAEAEKRRQDFGIDALEERVRQTEEQLALASVQLGTQKDSTERANKMLREATAEMEAIQARVPCCAVLCRNAEVVGLTTAAARRRRRESTSTGGGRACWPWRSVILRSSPPSRPSRTSLRSCRTWCARAARCRG